MGTRHIVALSGGKDSTALALLLRDVEPRKYEYVLTPTGDELPDMFEHWNHLSELLGKKLTIITPTSLSRLIRDMKALPNWRMRWCTRLIKIEPFQQFVLAAAPCVVYVGLRADEEGREGIEWQSEEVTQRFPLREWGWGVNDVRAYLDARGVQIPRRTDCGMCFFQTLSEWHALWSNYPERFERYARMEEEIGHTLRSDSRDTWPAALRELGARFAAGDVPRGRASMDERKVMCSTCAR